MISHQLITKAAIDTINNLGIGYRIRLVAIEYINKADELKKGAHHDRDIKSRIDVKLHDSVIDQIALIQVDNLGTGENPDPISRPNDIEVDDLPATVLEDYPEVMIPDSWLKHRDRDTNPEPDDGFTIDVDGNTVSDNFRQILDKADGKSDFINHYDAEVRDGYKVYDINVDSDGNRVMSDINELI